MPVLLNWRQIRTQSESVFNQFGKKVWIPQAKENAKLERRDTVELHNIGIGRHLVCAAMGESLEMDVETIKKYRDRVDVLTCDKGFQPLLERGIKADYVILCDANIPYRYISKAIHKTKGVKLLATPYANPKWTRNWKGDRYFFINKDSLGSEKIFLKIFGDDTRVIPAGSNVSNAMVIFMTGADENENVNYSGYETFLLTGYDYSWRINGNYYAWHNPKPKRYYMNHRTLLDIKNTPVHSSENLLFSAKWLYSYITTYNLPVVNCSQRGLLDIPLQEEMETALSSINKEASVECRKRFEAMRHSYMAHMDLKKSFEESRLRLTV